MMQRCALANYFILLVPQHSAGSCRRSMVEAKMSNSHDPGHFFSHPSITAVTGIRSLGHHDAMSTVLRDSTRQVPIYDDHSSTFLLTSASYQRDIHLLQRGTWNPRLSPLRLLRTPYID